jgi:hypothetical protein
MSSTSFLHFSSGGAVTIPSCRARLPLAPTSREVRLGKESSVPYPWGGPWVAFPCLRGSALLGSRTIPWPDSTPNPDLDDPRAYALQERRQVFGQHAQHRRGVSEVPHCLQLHSERVGYLAGQPHGQ